MYASRRCLGITKQQVSKSIGKCCNDSRSLPWDPSKEAGKAWFIAFLQRHPKLMLRSSRIDEANLVSAADHTRLDVLYNKWQDFCDNVQLAATQIWSIDEAGNYEFRLAALALSVSRCCSLGR